MKTTAKIITVFFVVLALVGPSFAGQIVAWGSNNSGQRDVPAGDDFVSIAAGAFHGLALKSDGSLVAWGNNDAGRSEVPEGDDFLDITAGSGHNLVLKSDGSLIAWGWNNSGQCDVAAGNDFVAIAAGWYHSLAIKSDGSLAAWGYNYYGQCNVPAGNDFVDVAAGFSHSLALKSNGSLVAWGNNGLGQCNVPSGNHFVDIAAGFTHSLALKSDGSLKAWGYNRQGQCNVPVGNDFVAIAANDDYCLALRSDGSLRAWGSNISGRCNVPTGNSFTTIATGKYHGIALESEPVTLVGIEIVGPDEVGENYHSQYKAVAYYEDGSTRNATNPAMWWVEPEAIATIESGLLQTKGVGQLQYITIYTTYTEGEVTVESEMTIQVYPSRTFYVPTDYETIQAAIDAARDVDRVIVADGTYTGPGNRDIDFLGKAITVRSESGPENCIIDCNGTEAEPHRGFYFHSGEDTSSIIDGFTITNGYAEGGGGIYCYDSSPTITNCNIIGNSVVGNGDNTGFGGGIYSNYSSPTIANCTISGNSAEWSGGGINCTESSPTITNCTITSNTARTGGGIGCEYISNLIITNCKITGNSAYYCGGGIFCRYDNNTTIANCTFAENSAPNGNALACDSWAHSYPSSVQLTNCILWGGGDEIWNNDGSTITITYSDIQGGWPGQGNIDADPCFVEPGYWADANDPNIVVEPNDPNAIWIDGDYHLKSEGWQWDVQRKIWRWDDVTSRCIDAGNPGCPLGEELLSVPYDPNNEWGQNLRINMGAYGGTAEASMPPYDWALLADLTNDGTVNFEDYAGQAIDWLESVSEQPGDLNRDGTVDTADIALLTEDWLKQTSWYTP